MRLLDKLVVISFCLCVPLVAGCGGKTEAVFQSVKDSVADDKPSDSELDEELVTVAPSSLKFFDLDAKLQEPFADDTTKAVVLVFIATDCPIANYYQPTLARLAEDYVDDGIRFFLVHADQELKKEVAVKHAEEFNINSPIILDSDLKLARLVKAKVTPEAHVIDRTGKARYRGRIDNLYADFGKRRREPTVHDLKDAIECVVRGTVIKPARTKAVGCYIPYPQEAEVTTTSPPE